MQNKKKLNTNIDKHFQVNIEILCEDTSVTRAFPEDWNRHFEAYLGMFSLDTIFGKQYSNSDLNISGTHIVIDKCFAE